MRPSSALFSNVCLKYGNYNENYAGESEEKKAQNDDNRIVKSKKIDLRLNLNGDEFFMCEIAL